MNNDSFSADLQTENIKTFGFQLFLLIVALLGTISHIINIAVLLSLELKDISYKFMLANSVNNTFYLLLCGINVLFLCKDGCEKRDLPLMLIIFFLVIEEYLTSCMAVFNLLILIFLSLQRTFIVLNKSLLQNISAIKSILIFSLISLIFYSPILTIQRIELSNQNATSNNITSILYSTVPTEFGSSAFGKQVRTILNSLRIFTATVLLTIANLINFIAFKRYFDKRKKMIKMKISKTALKI
jgi:hypothetical protein